MGVVREGAAQQTLGPLVSPQECGERLRPRGQPMAASKPGSAAPVSQPGLGRGGLQPCWVWESQGQLSTYPSTRLFIHPRAWSSIHASICPSIHHSYSHNPSVHPYIHPSIDPSTHPFIY